MDLIDQTEWKYPESEVQYDEDYEYCACPECGKKMTLLYEDEGSVVWQYLFFIFFMVCLVLAGIGLDHLIN